MKKKKERQVKTFVECHNTCARSSGRTCKFWGVFTPQAVQRDRVGA